jgi:gliding motility-associated-like protein/uncharacterized repeat protein (TIGR01451 family)
LLIINWFRGFFKFYSLIFISVFLLAFTAGMSANAQVDLEIAQHFSEVKPKIGDVITLTLTAKNNSSRNATGVTVNDLLPIGFKYISRTVGTDYDPGTGIWSIRGMSAGNTVQLQLQVEVLSNDSYINVANISGAEIESDLKDNVTTDSVAPVYTIAGNVFYDVNGFTDALTNNSSNKPLFAPIYVSLLDEVKAIMATKSVLADKKFTFENQPGGFYQLVLHNNPSGSSTPNLLTGWVNTSEGFSGASDAVPDGMLLLKTNSVNASELVFKEDFGPGEGIGPALEAGITTYTYKVPNLANNSKVEDGFYTIASNAQQGSNTWQNVSDHTSAGTADGRFLLVNADTNPKEFYQRKVSGLLPNQAYQLTFWAINVNSKADFDYCSGTRGGFVFPNIRYSIKNALSTEVLRSGATGVVAYAENAQWIKYTFDFNTSNNTEVNFILTNTAPGGCGNDLGIDDISVTKVPTISINSVTTDFGIQERPKTDLTPASIRLQNPGEANAVDVPAAGFSGTDDGTIEFVHITAFPEHLNSLLANGRTYTRETFPSEGIKISYNAAGIQVDPNDGPIETVIEYKLIDNAGFESLNTGKLPVAFEVLSVGLSGPGAVNEKDGVIKYTATLNGSSGLVTSFPITVQTGIAAGNAAASDYVFTSAAITFPAGSPVGTTGSFEVVIKDDALIEGLEDYTATLSSPTGGVTLVNSSVVTTITDNDEMQIVLSGTSSVVEGNEVIYTATLTGTADGIQDEISVDYKITDGTAKAGTDYTSLSGKLTFAAGAARGATQTFTVQTTDDKLVEPAENYNASISGSFIGRGLSLGTAEITTSITDNDEMQIVLSGESTVTEGGLAKYTATLTGTANGIQDEISVDYKIVDGTAKAGTDYTSSSGKLTFAAGAVIGATQTFTVQTTDDKLVEQVENYTASISNVVGLPTVTIETAEVITTITDNDEMHIVLTGLGTVAEGAAVTYTATLSGTADGIQDDISVDYKTADGSAKAGFDYAKSSGKLTFAAGAVKGDQLTFTVQTTDDKLVEPAENYTASLSNVVGLSAVTIETAEVVTTITDNDKMQIVLSGASNIAEGNEVTYTATLTGTADGIQDEISVDYKIVDGTAKAGFDYTSLSGKLTFAAGAVRGTTKTFTVLTTDDKLVEPAENYTAGISASFMGSGVSLGTAEIATTITDNDEMGIVLTGLATVAEGNEVTYTATLTGTADGIQDEISVDYKTVDDTAKADSDYTSLSGRLTFAAGAVKGATQTFTVQTTDDKLVEPAENYTAVISNVVGLLRVTIETAEVVTTVTDNDEMRIVLTGLATVAEGAAVTYTATLTGTADGIQDEISLDYKTVDGSAMAGFDYTSSSGKLTFAAGAVKGATKTFTVQTTDDKLVEPAENYTASISGSFIGSGVSLGTAEIATTITDNDELQIVLTGLATVAEGNEVIYTATLTGAADGIQDEISVDYKTADGTAKAGADYTSSSGKLTFAAGAVKGATQTFTVQTADDKLVEPAENYTASISNVVGLPTVTIETAEVVTTITNNDEMGIVLSGLATVAEGTAVTYTVTLTGTAEGIQDEISLDYKTVDGTAKAGFDYTSLSGKLTFAAGAVKGATQTFTVQTTDDKLVEPAENYTAIISNVVGLPTVTIETAEVITTITDNDEMHIVLTGLATVAEGAAVTYTATLTGTAGGIQDEISVDYKTVDGTAKAGFDYTSSSGKLTFAAGAVKGATQTFTVQTTDDKLVEQVENYTASISNVVGLPTVTIETAEVITTITDNDEMHIVLTGLATVAEGAAVTYTATLTGTADGIQDEISVDYKTADGSAKAGLDYTSLNGKLTFPAGAVRDSKLNFTVQTINDKIVEPAENYTASISGSFLAGGVSLGAAEITTEITDNDVVQIVLSGESTVTEGGLATYRATLTGTAEGIQDAISVEYKTVDGSAKTGFDYTSSSGKLTFAAGAVRGSELSFTVQTTNDKLVEPAETYTAVISNAVGLSAVTIETSEIVTTITDNDEMHIVLRGEATVTEGGLAKYTATLTGTADGIQDEISVDYKTVDGTANAGFDYTSSSGKLTFAAGAVNGAQLTFTVQTTDDKLVEPAENYTAVISGVVGLPAVTIETAEVLTTITDNDEMQIVLSGASTIAEGNEVTYIATLTGIADGIQDEISVDYKITDGTAKAGFDYTSSSGKLTFAAGAVKGATKTFTVQTTDDKLVELVENYTASISGSFIGSGVSLGTAEIATTITDNDELQIVLTGLATVAEGNEVIYTATLTGAADGIQDEISVDYKTADATAKAGSDYTSSSGKLTFAAGAVKGATQTFTVQTADDKLVEPAENYTASISNVVGLPTVTIETAEVVTTITNNDEMGIVLSGLATVAEGTAVTYTVTLTGTAEGIQDEISVNYKTIDNSAKAGFDYTNSNGKLTFAAGAVKGATQTFTVQTTDDKLVEPAENYTASISGSFTGAGISLETAEVVTTVTDNDEMRIVLTGLATVAEGAAVTYTATLTGTADGIQDEISLDYKTADGTAKADADYTSSTGKLTFAAGAVRGAVQTFTVQTTDDKLVEPAETYTASISGNFIAGGVSVGTAEVTTEITDNDEMQILLSGASTIAEGKEVTYTATLTGTADGIQDEISVDYKTTDGTAKTGADYTSVSGKLTFPAGAAQGTQQTFTVKTIDDKLVEPIENYTASISGSFLAGGVSLGTAEIATTITDNDEMQIVLSGAASVAEGTAVTYTATLTGAADGIQDQISVDYKTVDGTAKAGADYNTSGGKLTFAAGAVRGAIQTFTVQTTDDKLVEPAENYTASISGSFTGAGISLETAEVITTITDNDEMRIVLSGASSVAEGTAVTYTATLVGTAGGIQDEISVDYKTADGSAKAGADYNTSRGRLTFTAGAVSGATQTFTVQTSDDKMVEPAESYTASISDVVGLPTVTIESAEVITTITDNDEMRIVLSGLATIAEGAAVTYTATLAGTADGIQDEISVDYKTVDGSAKAGIDYTSSSGKLTFSAGAVKGATQTFTVQTTDDKIVEPAENFTANISGNFIGMGVSLGTVEVITTITDNDEMRIVLSGPATINEGGLATYTATLTGNAEGIQERVSLSYKTTDGSAKAGADYVTCDCKLNFAAGSLRGATQTFTVQTLDDRVVEAPEAYTASISEVVGLSSVTIETAEISTTITDNDEMHVVLSGPATIAEGALASYTVTLVGAVGGSIQEGLSVDYKTVDGSAMAGADYTSSNGQLIFAAGSATGATKSFTVETINDKLGEPDEIYTVLLTNLTGNAALGESKVETLIKDVNAPTITLSNASAIEGSPMAFPFALSNPNSADLTLIYQLINGTADNSDYKGSEVTVLIKAGETAGFLKVPTLADDLLESDETFRIVYKQLVSGIVGSTSSSATGTIIDNNAALKFSKEISGILPQQPGEILNYKLVLANTGHVPLTNISITDDNAKLSRTSVPSLAPNDVITIYATHILTQSDIDEGRVTNQAKTIWRDPQDHDVVTLSDDPSTPIPDDPTIFHIKQAAGIALVKTGVLNKTGTAINYTFSVSNTGNVTLSDLVLTDPLLGGLLVLKERNLLPGASMEMQKEYRLSQSEIDKGLVSNTAIVKATTPSGGQVSDVSGATVQDDNPTNTQIGNYPGITLVKTGVFNADLKTIVYTFKVTNTGNVTLYNLNLSDDKISNSLPLNVNVLVPGVSTTTTARYTISTAEKIAGQVINTAVVTAVTAISANVRDISGITENDDEPTVVAVVVPPVANDDFGSTKNDVKLEIPVVENDIAKLFPLDKSTLIITGQPSFGSLVLGPDGRVTYTPDKGYIGTDRFKYQIKDSIGISSNEATVSIQVTPPDLEIPNAFTPNGDGKNDRFEIKGRENYDNIELSIYNRWGDEVYRNMNYKNEWDGSNLNEGTYYYLLRLKKGTVVESRRSWVLIKR